MISSGSCGSSGCEILESKAECEKAANILELMDQSANVDQVQGLPYGCLYTNNDWLMFYPPDGPPYPPALCGSNYNGSKYDCICRKGGNILLPSFDNLILS